MRTSLLVVALCLVGCGGANLSGEYAGQALQSTTCSDGSGGSQNDSLDWTVSDNGDSAAITFAGGCSPISAHGNSESMSFDQKDCGGGFRIQAGSIAANSGGISIAMELVSAVCTTTFNGNLSKR